MCSNLRGELNLVIKLEGRESGKQVLRRVTDGDDRAEGTGVRA